MDTILANKWQDRRVDGYDVVVVGSGYGGAITAARLVNADLNPRLKVCVLERGQEWPVGQFPDSFEKVLENAYDRVLNPLGLYEFNLQRDIAIIKGSGLGGTSLVNANVAIRPDREIFKGWPSAIRKAADIDPGQDGSLWDYYKMAEQTLGVSPHPEWQGLKKIQALQKRASQLGSQAGPLNIAVNFTAENEVVFQTDGKSITKHKCIDCGDCVTGCNVGAKNTLYMNYLPLAKKGGAHIFTQTEVEYVKKAQGGGWDVHVIRRERNQLPTKATIRAGLVILAAGSLGSTEILLRSEKEGLALGAGIGSRFSGNGDFFGLAYNADQVTDIVGWGNHPQDPIAQEIRPGPSIVGIIRYNQDKSLGQRFTIEDVSIPRAYTRAAAAAFRIIRGVDTDIGVEDERRERRRRRRDESGPHPKGALNSTMLYLCMANEDPGGSMSLDPFNRIRIDWRNAGRQAIFRTIDQECREHATALGASFISNPIWNLSPWNTLITAHPLGGCPMGEEGSDGAVDHLGRVFSGLGAEVHDGLYVADGAVIRTAIGVNPFLTISALSERIAHNIILSKKGVASPTQPASVTVPASVEPLDPVAAIDFPEDRLERIFKLSKTLPMEMMVNSEQYAIDWENRRISNDRFWKGFFPRGSALNAFSSILFTGFKKRFFLEAGQIRGVTSDSDGRINARNTLEEISLNEDKGTLEKGDYVLLKYPDPPWQLFYDVFKVVNEDLLIGRVYFGVYPNGIRIMTFPMVRNYSFGHMTVDDFRHLYDNYGARPDPARIEGVWYMNAIANSSHSEALARLAFDLKPDGRFEARYQFLNIFEGQSVVKLTGQQLELYDFTPLHDEMRMLSPDYMIGKWATNNIQAFGPFHTSSSGLIHTEKTADGSKRFSFYYTLRRGVEAELPPPILFDRILAEPVSAGLTFDEVMVGDYYPGEQVAKDTDIGRLPQTKGKGVECSFNLKMVVEDLDSFIISADHRARPIGTIHFGEFAGQQDVTYQVQPDTQNTFFDYLRENPVTGEREMRYSLKFTAGDGKTYLLWGIKYMQRDHQGSVQEVMQDYTTLYTRIYELEQSGGRGPEVGVALLKFRTFEDLDSLASFLKFLTSFEVIGTTNPYKKIQARNKFNVFSLHFIFREYDPLLSGLIRIP